MSNTLNQLVCVSKCGNTGQGDCFLDPKKIEGFFLAPSTWTKTAAQIAAGFKASLQADTYAAVGTRIFPVHNLISINDGSEELVIETLGYGAKKPVREGFLDWKFEIGKGGLALNQNLRKWNGTAPSVLFYDSDGTLFGYNNNGLFSGIPLQFFWQHPIKVNTGQNITKYVSQFSFNPKYLNDFMAYVQTDFDLTLVKGLINVPVVLKNQSTNVFTVTTVAEQGGVDPGLCWYSAALTTTSNWVATNLTTWCSHHDHECCGQRHRWCRCDAELGCLDRAERGHAGEHQPSSPLPP
jgi:hypothetical protein